MEFNTLTTTLTNFVGVFQGGYARLQPIVNSLLGLLAGIDIVLIGSGGRLVAASASSRSSRRSCSWASGCGSRRPFRPTPRRSSNP